MSVDNSIHNIPLFIGTTQYFTISHVLYSTGGWCSTECYYLHAWYLPIRIEIIDHSDIPTVSLLDQTFHI